MLLPIFRMLHTDLSERKIISPILFECTIRSYLLVSDAGHGQAGVIFNRPRLEKYCRPAARSVMNNNRISFSRVRKCNEMRKRFYNAQKRETRHDKDSRERKFISILIKPPPWVDVLGCRQPLMDMIGAANHFPNRYSALFTVFLFCFDYNAKFVIPID